MENDFFSPLAIDALGEMMNISLGSSATAVSNMLDHRVDITTPTVSVVRVGDFALGNLEPAMGVEIRFVSGLEGSNIMLLKRSDIKVIVDILMGTETLDEEFELNELTISAVCEVMNQMMGAASTALSDFLGRMVNISTPQSFELTDLEAFKRDHFPQGVENVVVVRFALRIEGALESEFMNVMSVELAKDLVSGFGLDLDAEEPPPPTADPEPMPAEPVGETDGGKMSQEEIERLMASIGGEEAEPAPAEPTGETDGGTMSQEEIERLMASMGGGEETEPAPPAASLPPQQPVSSQQAAPPPPMYPGGEMPGAAPPETMPGYPPPYGGGYGGYMGYPPMYPPYPPYPYPPENRQPQSAAEPKPQPEPKVVNAQPAQMPEMELTQTLGEEQAQNLELIMEVPLEVTVEIGRTRRKVQDILSFSKGALVVLDKLAGDQVDLFVNGKCIARGDVVVIDDNFGVRITEILQKTGLEGIAEK